MSGAKQEVNALDIMSEAVHGPQKDDPGGARGDVGLTDTPGLTWWQVAVIALGVAVAVSALSLTAYGWYTKRNSRFGVVDLQTVFDAKQLEFSEMALRVGATDKDREEALKLAQAVSTDMIKAVDTISEECGCVLLVRAAVVGQKVPDYTKALMEKMGMSYEKAEATRKRLADQMKRDSGADLAEILLGVKKPNSPPAKSR